MKGEVTRSRMSNTNSTYQLNSMKRSATYSVESYRKPQLVTALSYHILSTYTDYCIETKNIINRLSSSSSLGFFQA